MDIDHLNKLEAKLDEYFDGVKPADERSDLDDFAFEQALKLQDAIGQAKYEARKVVSEGSSQTLSASNDWAGTC